MESWQLAVLVRILAVAVVIYFSRKAMARPTRTLTFVGQFALAAFWTTIVAACLGQWHFGTATVILVGAGMINGLANYLMWNANAISTSRNGFFTAFDDIFAMVLMMLVVPGAVVSLTFSITLGIAFCVLSAILLAIVNYRKQRTGSEGAIPMRFYAFALGYALAWGLTIFTIGYFALKHVGVWQFASAWYLGTTLVALAMLSLDSAGLLPRPSGTERATLARFGGEVLVIGLANSASLVLQFTAFTAVTLVVLQPAFLVMDIVIPLAIGVLLFKERKQFGVSDITLYMLGIIGFMLILFGH